MKYTFENKVINIDDKEIEKLVRGLKISKEQAIETWLEDNDYIVSRETIELMKKPKVKISADKKPRKSTRKVDNEKKDLIEKLFQFINEMNETNDIKIENDQKLITFKIGENSYKLDLIKQRTKKAG